MIFKLNTRVCFLSNQLVGNSRRAMLNVFLGLVALSFGAAESSYAKESTVMRLPFMLKLPKLAIIAESGGSRVSAFDLESARLLWTVDLTKAWKEDWKLPAHGITTLFISSMRPGTDKLINYVEIELNDGKIGYIGLEKGDVKSPIQD